MSFGYADDPDGLMAPDTPPATLDGLDSFNSQAAADDLGAVTDNERARQAALFGGVDAVSGGAGPDETTGLLPDKAAPAPGEAAPGGVDVYNLGDPHAAPPAVPGAQAPGASEYPPAPQFPELPLPPPPPALTGDPQKDVMANAEYQRTLAAHHAELVKRQTALAEHAAAVGAMRGKKEAEVATVEAEAKKREVARAVAEREQRQSAINEAVAARAAAAKDVEGFKWDRPHTGGEIVALIASAIGSSMQNAAAAQLGQVGHAENEAAKGIEARMKREYDAKVAKLKGAGDALLMARYDAKTSQEAHHAAMNDLDAEMSAKYKAIAKEAESQLMGAGVPKAQAAGNVLVADANAKAAAHEGDILNREEARADSRTASAATLALAKANLGERQGEFKDTMGERRQEFRLRREDAADARAERERLAREKADEKKTKSDETLSVRDAGGIVRGYAPSSRVVKPIQDRVIQYDDAIKSAKDLLAYRREHQILGSLPTGDAYDRAVLAVAATTQANASDSTTAHEAGTLKQMGLVDEKAIKKTIEHLKTRQAAFMKQLRPVEGGAAPPPKGDGDKKAAPKVSGADAERMMKASREGDHSFDAILKANGLM